MAAAPIVTLTLAATALAARAATAVLPAAWTAAPAAVDF